jgi:hypothetical protein
MLCEAFHRLSAVQKMRDFRYVGFGATYFADFCLFHRDLGINDMFSIEANRDDEPRVMFNVPFSCIKVKMGKASDKLREIPWNKPAIVWLDYDYSIDSGVLFDLNLAASKATPYSLIIVTLDARPDKLSNPKTSDNRDIDEDIFQQLVPEKKLEEKVGPGKIPQKLKKLDLRGDGLCESYRRLVAYEIMNALGSRIVDGKRRLRYKQLFNFRYSDGQEMMTVGGIIYDPADLAKLEKCDFRHLSCYRPGSKYLRIKAPNLTFREIRELNRLLPTMDIDSDLIKEIPIPRADKLSYQDIYRYFPIFTEAEV